jgi:hypothetical protein
VRERRGGTMRRGEGKVREEEEKEGEKQKETGK